MARAVKFIAAIDEKRGLAKNHKLPWDLPTDRNFFRDSIASASGLMGWNTFADNNHKPYKTSPNTFVITHRDAEYDGVEIIHELDNFVEEFTKDLWVIGGGDVFSQLLDKATHLYLTRVEGDYDCDVFFPEFEDKFILEKQWPKQIENGIGYQIELWVPKPR